MTTEERILTAVNAGNLKHRMTIMAPAVSIDAYGNRKAVYSRLADVWAYVEVHASQISETTAEKHITRKSIIAFRYRPDVPADARYQVGGKMYSPSGAPIDACGAHRIIFVECIEEVKNGAIT